MQFKRLFTQSSTDPYSLIYFRQPEAVGDGYDIPLEHPDGWSREAVETLADEAAACALSPDLKPIEENTVPSWMWRQSRAKQVGHKETSVRAIFDRVAGAATYKGWKRKLFANEESARNFFDEARYALATRLIGVEPQSLALFGLEWAYGISVPTTQRQNKSTTSVDITNAMIDTVVSGKRDRVVLSKWQKIIGARSKASTLALRFADTEAQWETPAGGMPGARLNLMAFRHNDGSVNIEALRHAVRLAVVLMDVQDESAGAALALGYSNLAPLLMALALPYNSEAGRATAAAISAIITGEAYAASAELARTRGAASAFVVQRETCLRALRNHRRAAYGEQNDYEKMPVTPAPLALASCPDLALTAAARSAWDHALESAQTHGLRHTQVTGLLASAALALFMQSEADGLQPMRSLVMAESETENRRALHPSATEALTRLGYDAKNMQAITRHVVGAATLDKAPAINHASLRARGFTAEALEKLEAYLPQAKHIRYACTPWVVGVEFCRQTLKIPAAKIDDLRFNLLAHLGFSDADIAAANAWCYGHNGVGGAPNLQPQHAAAFATSKNLPPEARIRMASAVQGFLSGETDLKLSLPVGMSAERFEKLLLDAWRRGVKSVLVTFDANLEAIKTQGQDVAPRKLRKIASSVFLHAKAPSLPKRQSRSAASRLGGMSQTKPKSRSLSKGH